MVTSGYKCVHVFAHVTTYCTEQVQTLKLKKKTKKTAGNARYVIKCLDVADATTITEVATIIAV